MNAHLADFFEVILESVYHRRHPKLPESLFQLLLLLLRLFGSLRRKEGR